MIFVLNFLGIKLTDGDQDLYKNFPLVISERWQSEVSDTVFDTINHDYDKVEHKKRAKTKKFVGHSVVGGGPVNTVTSHNSHAHPNSTRYDKEFRGVGKGGQGFSGKRKQVCYSKRTIKGFF